MTALIAIGIVAASLLCLWVVVGACQLAFFCFIGFDEVNIPMGFVFLFIAGLAAVGWWWLVGSHINISFS